MTLSIPELTEQLVKGREQLKAKFEAYPLKKAADGSEARDIPAADIEGIRKANDDLNELGSQLKALQDAEWQISQKTIDDTPVNRLGAKVRTTEDSLSMAEKVFATDAFKNRAGGKKFGDITVDVEAKDLLGLELKTTMTTAAGFAPFVTRDGNIVPAISRPVQILDFLRIEPTTQNAVKFMKQTTRTNAAAAKAENVALDESALAWTEATVDIRKIGTYIPVTEEQLEDEAGVRSLIDTDLMLMVRQELDNDITVGTGTPPEIRGIYNATSVQTQAKGADPVFDALMKAATKVRVTGRAVPNLVAMHGNDYQELALTRTADGLYILGNPSDAPVARIWGMAVVQSEALTEGNGLVMDSNYFRVKLRKDVTIAATDSHGELFISNVLAIRAHCRAGLQILRDEAACRVTGI